MPRTYGIPNDWSALLTVCSNFYTESEFWDLYDRPKYEMLRKKWHAEALPNMYDKVRRKPESEHNHDVSAEDTGALTWKEWTLSIWPLAGLYQTCHVLFK
jgi:delta24-sterol reductase